MDIKDLNKSQLILLAILLSFITSIATGITTVTLMQQAPVSFVAPINRVIKQTVENIVPATTNNTVQTVVVKEEDLVVDAIAKNKSAVFSLVKEFNGEDGQPTEVSVGQAFVINTDGVMVADAVWVQNKDTYYAKNSSGKFEAKFLGVSKGVAFLKLGEAVDATNTPVYTVPAQGDMGAMKVGQKILVLGGTITSFIYDGSGDLKISVPKSLAGGLVMDLDGRALGMAISNETNSFVSLQSILEAFKTLPQ